MKKVHTTGILRHSLGNAPIRRNNTLDSDHQFLLAEGNASGSLSKGTSNASYTVKTSTGHTPLYMNNKLPELQNYHLKKAVEIDHEK